MTSPLYDDLLALASDLWWAGQPRAIAFWSQLDPALWEDVNHSPVALLQELGPDRVHKGLLIQLNGKPERAAQVHEGVETLLGGNAARRAISIDGQSREWGFTPRAGQHPRPRSQIKSA